MRSDVVDVVIDLCDPGDEDEVHRCLVQLGLADQAHNKTGKKTVLKQLTDMFGMQKRIAEEMLKESEHNVQQVIMQLNAIAKSEAQVQQHIVASIPLNSTARVTATSEPAPSRKGKEASTTSFHKGQQRHID